MKTKEESSFLQGVESRLDSLFAEDTPPVREKDAPLPQTAAADIREDIPAPQDSDEPAGSAAGAPNLIPPEDKSSFIAEIEKRFSAIFGEDDKASSALQAAENPDEGAAAAIAEEVAAAPPVKDQPSAPSSILHSPLKDMKSIMLSIEWEINDAILEQLEEEVNKLYLLYTGNRVLQGFLRLLRFLGRYIRVKGVQTNQESINLLLSVYDNLENVMVSEAMTEAQKQGILLDNIKKYRNWVEKTDLSEPEEAAPASAAADDAKPFFSELPEQLPPAQRGAAIQFPEAMRGVAEEPSAAAGASGIVAEKTADEALLRLELPAEERLEAGLQEAHPRPEPSAAGEAAISRFDQQVQEVASSLKNLPPDEAFARAAFELKHIFGAELQALKEEIRVLKSAR
ncbi:MAG: hypothetical protein PHG54_02735 [Smithellaceae bacterium]|nr:hypothetical protein [Syntrophaceae bacterium]MDD4240322.1 hypothetical protein [Smithellaceae bacterium]NLX51860.1 hypothetical protein [Deltaproteobacteria bacterium]